MRAASWLYRLVLRLYPRDMRERFGEEMVATFLAQVAETRQRSRGAWIVVALREIGDLLMGAFRELRNRRPGADLSLAPSSPGRSSDAWRLDVAYGFRRLVRDPRTSAVAVLTFALGLGASTAVFTLVDRILLRPLPYPAPERLVRVWAAQEEKGLRHLDATWQEVQALRASLEAKEPAFEAVAAFSLAPRDLVDDADRPRQITLARISPGFFEVLGIGPNLGRSFLAEEYEQGLPVVVLSHGLWRGRYGSSDMLGRTIDIQGEPHRIVGVMPSTFDYPHGAVLWRPFTVDENLDDDRELHLVARLAPGVEAAGASAVATVAFEAAPPAAGEAVVTAWVQPLRDMLVRKVDDLLWSVLGAVGALLLVALANVAHLQLARGVARRGELGLRWALGADRGRLVRQLITENVVLTSLGGLAGISLGYGLLQLVLHTAPADLPRAPEVSLDGRVVAAMVFVSLASGLVFGLASALGSGARRASAGLGSGFRASGDRGEQRLQKALVVGQVALATTLVITAGLLFASVREQLAVKPGFLPQGLVSIGVSPPPARDEGEARRIFYDELVERAEGLPAVKSAVVANFGPSAVDGFPLPFTWPASPERSEGRALLRSVGPGFERTVGARLVAGRPLQAADSAGAPGVVVVNETFVRTFLGGEDPLGQRIRHSAFFGDALPSERVIVGVIEDFRPDASLDLRPQVFVPSEQFPWPRYRLLLRLQGSPEALLPGLRASLWNLYPTLALDDAWPVEELLGRRLAEPKFQMRLMTGFSQLTLLLAAVGLYGVLAFQVARRRREIGVRMALGAAPSAVLRWVLGRGLGLVSAGIALGLGGGVVAVRSVEDRLFGVAPFEPAVWAVVPMILLATALLASVGPALRALQVSPVQELRAE